VAGHAPLVVRHSAERARRADRCAAIAELVLHDRGVVLGEAHVEAEHVLARDLVGERAHERAEDALLVRIVRVGQDAGLGAAEE
jgi:hypothetical protein